MSVIIIYRPQIIAISRLYAYAGQILYCSLPSGLRTICSVNLRSIKDWPDGERPRERLARAGARALSDAELLAVMLGHGTQGQSAVDLARLLLVRFGSIRGILNARPALLESIRGMGPGKAGRLIAIGETCCRYFEERNQHYKKNPQKAGNKIWGKELVEPVFSISNNCKNPKWR